MYTSVKENDFIKHEVFEPSQLADEKKKDLRTHHFSFGEMDPNMQSTMKTAFQGKEGTIISKENRQKQTNKMRRHNFKIGNGKNVLGTNSTYLQDYQERESKAGPGMSKEDLKQRLIDLRNTNMILGQDKPTMVSTMREHFGSKEGDRVELDRKALQKTNFTLGDARADLQSINRAVYVAHPPQQQINLEEKQKLINDLRNHHFDIGAGPSDYGTQSKITYKKHEGVKANKAFNPALQKTNFVFGDCDPQMASQYTATMKRFEPELYKKDVQARDQGMDRGTNWTMGESPGQWTSEAKQHFVNHPPLDIQKIKEEAKQNKGRPMNFGDGGVKLYTTEFQDSFAYNFDPNAKGQLNKELLNDLRSCHYSIKDDDKFRGDSEYRGNFLKGRLPPYSDYKAPKMMNPTKQKGALAPGEFISTYRSRYLHPKNNF